LTPLSFSRVNKNASLLSGRNPKCSLESLILSVFDWEGDYYEKN
jgi:hypothetical protein